MTKRSLIAAGAVFALLLTGCGSTADSVDAGAGTELRLAIGGESEDGYDPTMGWGRYGSPLFQSTLLQRDENLNIVNDLATGYQVSDDALTWTVTLRDDARFTDGEPVTAEDVAYTFVTASKAGGTADLTALDSARALDETTVELTLKEPQSTFVNRLVSLGIVPAHAHDEDYANAPIGSGPFEFVQWDRGQQLIVQRNDDYYAQLPEFERIVFVFSDEDGALAQAQAGEVDLAGVPSLLAGTEVPGMRLEVVESVDNRGLHFPYSADRGETFGPQKRPVGNDVTSDLAIRQAVNYAVDRAQLVEGVLEGFGSPASGPVDGMPWANPATEIEDADPERAIGILEDAGWVDTDGDGVREKDGTRAEFTLIYPASDSLRQGLALSVAEMVGQVGISIETKGGDWDLIHQRMHADPVLFGWGAHDPTELYTLYSAEGAGQELANVGFYRNDTVQQHLDAAMRATSEEEAITQWKLAQDDGRGSGIGAANDAAWAWLVNLDHTYLVDECLDLGDPQTEPHGHGWPITAGITGWSWTC